MPILRTVNIDELSDWFSRLHLHVKANKFVRHQDTNIEIEVFFRDLLSEIYGWELRNDNSLFGVSQDSFDLSSESDRVAVQVTVTTGSAKIRKTLTSFIGKHDAKYSRLYFVYPVIDLPKSRADYSRVLNGFDFCPAAHCVGLGQILSKIQDLAIDRQISVLNIVRKELAPLGDSLQIGVDATLDTLISVLEFMSQETTGNMISHKEDSPDLNRKKQRFKEHAEYILNLYRIGLNLHADIDEARKAIGYDAVRARKIQAWLKMTSLKHLSDSGNNAKMAFDSMVAELLSEAHSSGSNAEKTAVAFLLADEFIRCNVFPN